MKKFIYLILPILLCANISFAEIGGVGNGGVNASTSSLTANIVRVVSGFFQNLTGSSTATSTGASFLGSIASFFEVNVKNRSSSSGASSDLTATADNGNDSIHFINLGINNSGGGNMPFPTAGEGYLYIPDANLNIGAIATNSAIRLFAGSSTTVAGYFASSTFYLSTLLASTTNATTTNTVNLSATGVATSSALDILAGSGASSTLRFFRTGSTIVAQVTASPQNSLRISLNNVLTSYAYELAQNTLSVIAGSGASSTIDLYRTSSVLAARIQADPNSNLFIYNNNNSVTAKLSLLTSGNFGIGTTTPSERLTVSGNISATGNITCTGHLAAATKSFKIPHQTKAGYLQYGVVESNEHSVYVRGKTSDDTITLPDHWDWLVESDSVTVTLTPYGSHQPLYIISADNKKVVVGGAVGEYHYVVYGTRKDVEALVIETAE